MKRVKTAIDNAKRRAIVDAVHKELANVHYINKAAVDIYGKIHYLDEAHIRALQVVAAKLANNDREAFEDFKNNVIIYSGRDITHSTHQMHFNNKGYFEEDFQKGFYSSVYDLLSAFDDAQRKYKDSTHNSSY